MATGEQMIKTGNEPNLGTYWAQRPAYGHPEPHTVARDKIGLELSLASSRALPLVVAGPGFEPG